MIRSIKTGTIRAARWALRATIAACVLALVVLPGCGRNPPCPPPSDRVHEREIVRDVFGDAAADDFEERCPG